MGPKWDTVQLPITGTDDVTVPANAITALIPRLERIAKSALAALGGKVKTSLARDRNTAQFRHGI
jgi:hypothetical protein